MENPYASPPPANDWGDRPSFGVSPSGRPRGLVGQVRVLAVLMMVQGGFDILMGLMLIGIGVFFGVLFQNNPEFQRGNPNGPSPEVMGWIMGGMYGGFGLLALIAGIMNIYAGWQSFNFKGRTLGIVSLGAGMVTVLTCYCAPTSIALLIYGLIVYLDPSVKEAFEMGSRGHTPDQIDAAFLSYAKPPGV